MKRTPKTFHRTISRRSGAAMVFGLVALLVASMLIAVLLRTASLSHRQLKREEFRIQTSLLADAGIARAVARIRNQPDFTDEVWNVTVEQLSSNRTAVVRLKIELDPNHPEDRIVSVVAEYPSGQPEIVKISREMHIPQMH